MKVFILLGPPGSGKGTLAKRLAKKFPLVHLSTGDILRDAVSQETEIGLRVKADMAEGRFVDDTIVNGIVFARLRNEPHDILFDGYPRTLLQAKAFADFLSANGHSLGCVVDLDVPIETLEKRVVNRRICCKKECGTIYNLEHNPSRTENICDRCGSPLMHRLDDTSEAFRIRMNDLQRTFKPLQGYYSGMFNYRLVNGTGTPEDVFATAVKIFEEHA